MIIEILEDYIEILEYDKKESFIDKRHEKLLEEAKKELEKRCLGCGRYKEDEGDFLSRNGSVCDTCFQENGDV